MVYVSSAHVDALLYLFPRRLFVKLQSRNVLPSIASILIYFVLLGWRYHCRLLFSWIWCLFPILHSPGTSALAQIRISQTNLVIILKTSCFIGFGHRDCLGAILVRLYLHLEHGLATAALCCGSLDSRLYFLHYFRTLSAQ